MKSKHILLLLVFSLLSFLLLTGCMLTNRDALKDTIWVLTEINGVEPIIGTTLSIEFNEGLISGSAGCNHFGGDYKVDGEMIEFPFIHNTEMFCMEPVGIMDQEMIFLNLLRDSIRFTKTESELVLYESGNSYLRFEANPGAVNAGNNGDQTDNAPVDATVEVVVTEPPLEIIPNWDYNEYQDPVTRTTIYIPDSWIVSDKVDGMYAIFQSYPKDKYVGGGSLNSGDTKCDLNIKPTDTSLVDLIQQWESNSLTTIITKEDFVLQSGQPAIKIELDNMGRSISVLTEINERTVVFICFGDFTIFDEIAVTLRASD